MHFKIAQRLIDILRVNNCNIITALKKIGCEFIFSEDIGENND